MKGTQSAGGIGIWIDHRRAVVFDLAGEHEETIESGAEEVPRSGPGVRQTTGHGYGPDSHHHAERRREASLKGFYEAIAHRVSGAGRVVILGPDGARTELAKVIVERKGPAVHANAPADTHLTMPQVVALAREIMARKAP